MPEPHRELVLAAVVARLQGLAGTRYCGGGYPNPVTVTRLFRGHEQVRSFPHLCVVEGTGAVLQRADMGDGWQDDFPFVVFGWVHGDDVVVPSTHLQRLSEDVDAALLEDDPTLGGLVSTITKGPETVDEGALGVSHLAGFVKEYIATIHPRILREAPVV